jgi:hypothetical protein
MKIVNVAHRGKALQKFLDRGEADTFGHARKCQV